MIETTLFILAGTAAGCVWSILVGVTVSLGLDLWDTIRKRIR